MIGGGTCARSACYGGHNRVNDSRHKRAINYIVRYVPKIEHDTMPNIPYIRGNSLEIRKTMMTVEILWAVRKIKDINDNPQTSMQYYTNDCPNRNITNFVPQDIRYRLLCHLFEQTHRVDIIVELDNLYKNNQHYCWPSHAHHFHPTFEQYVNCPITCLAEIEEYLESMAYKVLGA